MKYDFFCYRSKAVKVLRSGRRALLLTTKSSPTQNHVNGYVKSLKNRALNGISSPGKTEEHQLRSSGRRSKPPNRNSSPGKIRSSSTSSAYAKHYKSYRRNSSTTRRNLMLSRSPVRAGPSSAPSSSTNQRSLKLKFKSTTPTSGRLRLRRSDLDLRTNRPTSTPSSSRKIVQKSKVNLVKKKLTPKSPLPSCSTSSLTNGGGSHHRQVKSRSASASSTNSSSNSSPKFGVNKQDQNKVQHRKSRSALWVLNCEAEEFLFGETAADKHELELPAARHSSSKSNSSSSTTRGGGGGESPPPKKRRRWRETELSHLLETSPFLESKLRSNSSPSSINTSPGEDLVASPSEGGVRKVKKVNVKLNFDRVQGKQKVSCC